MPDFGRLHDDALMFVTAQSIAHGQGYRIPSLPENPYQTKYPPLFPAYLSLAWILNPSFPGNLTTAIILVWPWLVVFRPGPGPTGRGRDLCPRARCC